MLLEEAKWLNRQLMKLNPADVFPMCNIGSSTERFRTIEQPYIDEYLFAPARDRNLKVIHVDQKAKPGVDLVGDVTNQRFLEHLIELNFHSVMCCNLLEHVSDRRIVCRGLMSIVGAGGYIIVTVPHRYPYHEDPIDTMFRPTIKELASLFAGASIREAAIVRANRNYAKLFRLIVRVGVPFYRPQHWWEDVRRLLDLAIGYSVTCIILCKDKSSGNS